jgi:hypothetical protein
MDERRAKDIALQVVALVGMTWMVIYVLMFLLSVFERIPPR